VSTFVLGILTSLWNNMPVTLSDAAVLKFGIMPEEHPIPLYELSGACIIGLVCGVMGAIFIRVQIILLKLRKKSVLRNWQKVLEVSMFSAFTATTFFLVAITLNKCIPKSDPVFPFYHNARCPENEYSPMATLFFNTEGGTIRSLLSKAVTLNLFETSAFLLAWTLLFFTTFGVQVPSGVFVPGIIIGLAVGQLYGNIWVTLFPSQSESQSYLLVGAAAMLTSYTRMTYSLAVIMLETTQSINLFIPMIFSMVVARSVSKLLSRRSLYEVALVSKSIPFLGDRYPSAFSFVRAEEIMSRQVHTLRIVSSMEELNRAYKSDFSGFPVLNESGNLVGIVPRRFIGILIEKREFISMSAQNYDIRNMKSANALLYLSPQYDNLALVTPAPINEEDEFNAD